MSARKPLARMESPIVTEPIEKDPPITDFTMEEINVSKPITSENGEKPDTIPDTKCETKEPEIKQEPDEAFDTTPISLLFSNSDAKRLTRNSNSPMMMAASPLKKKPSDSQEQDSTTESTNNTIEELTKGKDKSDKATTSRGRKSSDQGNKSSSTSVPPTNRLTRKSAMKDWADNTRLTRAKRVSAGLGQRSETPPKRKYVFKKNLTESQAPAVKRKRSASPKPNSDEPEAKISKPDDPVFDINSITIKQEILESSEEMTSDVASDITDMFPAEPSTRISLRARKTVMSYSPTTRIYRRDKDKVDGRKKKQSRVRLDEDSKDSMASSNIDEMVEVKSEQKFQSEEVNDFASISYIPSKVDAVANGADDISVETTDESAAVMDIIESIEKELNDQPLQIPTKSVESPEEVSAELPPLSVDTTETKEDQPSTSAAAVASEQSNSSEKSASLSPEMVSEGVSEMSVKQFYKKPEFLENNLGIENDPKLGEIVQNVSDRIDDMIDQTNISNESIKEGELIFEGEDDDVESIGTIKNDHEEDEDANSVSTGFISPLLVEEEEEEEEENDEQTFLNGKENIEETSNSEDFLHGENTIVEEPKETVEIPAEENKFEEIKSDEIKAKLSDSEECEVNETIRENKMIVDESEAKEISLKEMSHEESKAKETSSEEITTEKSKAKESSLDEMPTEESKVTETNFEEIVTEESKAKEVNCKEMETEEIEPEKVIQKSEEEPLESTEVSGEIEPDIKKTEICDKITKSDIEKTELKCEIVKATITEIDKNEETPKQEEEVAQKMELDDLKIEASEETKIVTDQEENKENMELSVEAVIEGCQETHIIKTPIEKDTSTDELEESPSESSKNTSPTKVQVGESSGETTTPSTSPQSSKSSKSSGAPRTPETDDKLRQKERHLKTLGLLTHKAADEAIMAKQKRRKFLHNLNNNSSSKKSAAANSGTTAGNGQNKSAQEYTGTLKTIIKINRQTGGGSGGGGASEPKKVKNGDGNSIKASTSGYGNRRHSLKMTFQKGRGRPANTEKAGENPANTSGDDSYYTIQNEGGGATTSSAVVAGETPITTQAPTNIGRKSYNRSNTLNISDPTPLAEHHELPVTSKKDEKEEILIPEKASSFKFHPGRLCQDQCYYCSGKFGLYDTPCHVGQIKSVERQQKILSNEEKLTVDNCLCDACFRHVDRRANVPSYKKRLSVPGRIETTTSAKSTTQVQEQSEEVPANGSAQTIAHLCAVPDCELISTHSLRRKNIRKSIKKSLLNFDMSSTGTYLHICDKHYDAFLQSSGCVLCKRRLGKTNMYHITTDTDRLEKALAEMGIPVVMGQCTAVCKLCRYFANLLIKPPEHGKVQKVEFVKNYRKRLLQFYNIHDKKESSHEEDKTPDKEKPKKKAKSKLLVENLEKPIEIIELPPSPTPSTGSSVEMISDGGLFSGDESSAKTKAGISNSSSNQMVLDNDVLVDYDVPLISDGSSSGSSKSTSPSPQKTVPDRDEQSKLKAILQSVGTSCEDRSDISTALRSNPNISMRELFPGEEDLGLQFKAPFGGSSSQRTPEGWTRINTFLQYDEPTRRLWEDLQKPYGNQSSFLRHLILLEKYYRNGDLTLSSTASSNATVYTQTVHNRLTSFDSRCSSPVSAKQIESRSRSLSVDKIQRQLSSNSVTITARPKDSPKDQQKEPEIDKQTLSSAPSAPLTLPASTTNSRSILKANVSAPKGNSSIEIVSLNSTPSSSSKSNSPHSPNRSGSTTPNDNSTMTKQQKILAAANKLMSNKLEASPTHKKVALNTTPPELISLNKRPVTSVNLQQVKRPLLLPKPIKIPPNVVVLPDTLTSQERQESRSWRPTLLPVTTNSHHLNNQQGPLYQTADGRRLPALVQVQSGGRPFLISIHDYNRMCILRREKLMRDQMMKGSKAKLKGPIVQPIASSINSNLGKQLTSNAALLSFNKTMQAVGAENAAKKQRLLLAKSLGYTAIAPKPIQTLTSTTTATSTCTSQTQSQPNAIPAAAVNVKPISLLTSTSISNLSVHPNLTGQVLPQMKAPSTATMSGVPSSSWLWNNFPDPNQMLMNGKSATTSKGPQTNFTTIKHQQSLLLDNSLMSKIPKSLTVIPQHKLMPAPPSGQTSGGSITKK